MNFPLGSCSSGWVKDVLGPCWEKELWQLLGEVSEWKIVDSLPVETVHGKGENMY